MLDLRPFRSREARLSDWLPWAGLVAPGVILNKDGAFQRTLEVRGPDLDSSTPAELAGACRRLDGALRRLGSGWCVHVEARRGPAGPYPESAWPDALSWLMDEERRAAYEAAGARFESRYYITFTHLPPTESAGSFEAAFFGEQKSAGRRASIDYALCLERFIGETQTLKSLLELVFVETRFLDDDQTLTFLHDAVSDRPHAVRRPAIAFHLDDLLADAPLTGGAAPRLGEMHLRVLSIRGFPPETEPQWLEALDRLGLSYRWVTRYLPLDRETARREFEKVRKRWFSKRKGLMTLLREALFKEEAALQDNDAANQAVDADLALQELQGSGCGAGYMTLTLTLMDSDEARLAAAVRTVQQAMDSLGLVSAVETINAVEAWLGSLPGQAYADLRRPIVMTPTLAHLAPVSAVWAGKAHCAHLKGPPLLVAATDGATPFRLNLHHGDVGHTLLVGPTGAGKSVALGLIAAQWRRYERSRIVILDVGRSSRALVLGLGGIFLDLLGENAEVAFQPLRRIDEASERAFAQDWLMDLFARSGLKAEPSLKDEVWAALGVLAGRPADERTLSLLAGLLQQPDLRRALEPFTHAGPHGGLLDADCDPLLDADVLALELGDLISSPTTLGVALPCLVRALERDFDGRPTLLILDEAWAYLRDPAFAAQVQTWLKTLRKKNVAVVYATQEIADIDMSGIAATLLEACPTRIFLANERAREPRTARFYEALGLNERQLQLIAEGAPKRDYYVQTRAGARRVDFELGPAALAFLGASRPEDQAAVSRVLGEAGAGGFAQAWLRRCNLGDAADALARFDAMRAPGNDPGPGPEPTGSRPAPNAAARPAPHPSAFIAAE